MRPTGSSSTAWRTTALPRIQAAMSRTDRAIGIALGLVIGVVALILLILGSGNSIDASSLESTTQAPAREAPAP